MDRKKKIKTNSDIFHPTLRKTLWFLIDWSLMWLYQNLFTEPENCSLLATCEQLSLWKLVLGGGALLLTPPPKAAAFLFLFTFFLELFCCLKVSFCFFN